MPFICYTNCATSIRRFELIGGALLLLLLLFSFVVPTLFHLDPFSTHLEYKNSPPSLQHPFGTDELGRDMLARTCSALRLSFTVGAIAAAVDFIIGLLWGMIAATSGPIVDTLLMRVADVLYSIPYLLLVLLLTVVVGHGYPPIILSMLIVGWIQTARIVRMLTKQILQTEYVVAAKVLGVGPLKLFFHHVFPNMTGAILAAVVLTIPQAIFSEAFLSFLGVGIQPPEASLGSLVADALPALRFFPWRLLFPSGVIVLLVTSLTLLADGLQIRFDPKAHISTPHKPVR